MTKLFSKGILFSFIGFFILHILASFAQEYAPDGTSTFFQIDKLNIETVISARQNVQAIVLGNSHGDNITFETMGLQGYSLSRAWGDLFETQHYLKYLVPRLPNLEIVFIPISYFSFNWDNGSIEKLEDRRSQIYTILPAWNFIRGDLDQFLEGKVDNLFPIKTVVREDHWKGVFYAVVSGKKVNSNINQILQENCNYQDQQTLEDIAEVRVLDTIDMGQQVASKRPDIQTATYATLVETVEFLHSRGIRVVFFTPPYYHEYSKIFMRESPDSISNMNLNISKLIREKHIEYYDFSFDKTFIDDIRLYRDSDHLNLCGKQSFSRELFIRMNGNMSTNE
jgi:hypothetical protein